MKAYFIVNAAVSGAALGPRASTATLPAGAGPKCTDAAGQNPGALAGAASGKQFATGCCLSDSDCETACCGLKTGICQDLGVAVQPQVGGCHGVFGVGAASPPPTNAANAGPVPEAAVSAPAEVEGASSSTCSATQDPGKLAGKGSGTQFITGCCDSDADCQSKCCGKNNGLCQAVAVAHESPAIGSCGGIFTSRKML